MRAAFGAASLRCWLIVAVLAAVVQALSACWLLALDAAAEPFSALLPPAETRAGVRTVVLMHHKRLPELEATLRRLAGAATQSASALPLTVHVAQSLPRSEMAAANATAALLRSLGSALPALDIWHAPAVLPAEAVSTDGSYSVDARKFGTKKNSFRNMVRGLDAAFGKADPPAYAVVMEDDVEVSLDVMSYFELGAGVIDATRKLEPPRRVGLATSFCILRSAHPDYGYKGWLPGDWLAKRPDRYRRLPLRHVTFKTFAWLASREVYETMRYDTSTMFALPGGERRLHSSLAGCPYCDNFCYDHYLEWRFRNESVLCPEMPRSRQYVLRGGGGMTEKPGSVTDDTHALERSGTLLNAEHVSRWQHADGEPRQRARRVLNGLALWGLPVGAAGLAARGTLRLFALRASHRPPPRDGQL